MSILALRKAYHKQICEGIIREKDGKKGRYPNFADAGSTSSIQIAWGIVSGIGCEVGSGSIEGQTAGRLFEAITKTFLEQAFEYLTHLRPGRWHYDVHGSITEFDQYEHLGQLEKLVKGNTELESVLGSDYIIKPDIVVGRWPVTEEEINRQGAGLTLEANIAKHTPLRRANQPRMILHASISCKWTIRSDRTQNTRTEALNLIRNRKGTLPHVAAVTAEPLPTRLAAIALGTGDLDCVYHFALPELEQTLEEIDNEDQMDMLRVMVEGRRLRDISDLPFDLAI